jgi:beta-lactamase superfamily II metal-dependent hydrolase
MSTHAKTPARLLAIALLGLGVAACPGRGAAPPGAAAAPVTPGAPAAAPLRIQWIDVEGGAATLVVAPTGETLLVDTGFPGPRDADRIARAVRAAGASRLDYVVVTHYHLDHVGGVRELAARVPIGTFVDHGENVEAAAGEENAAAYPALAGARRRTVKAGDTLALGEATLVFVAAAGRTAPAPEAAAAPNRLCEGASAGQKDPGNENSMSLGFVLRYGRFRFLNLGDLMAPYEHELVCPANRLGPIDLFQVTHHGNDQSNPRELVHSLGARAAVVDNGPRKGGSAAVYEHLRTAPRPIDPWQLHRAVANDDAHNAPEAQTANPEGGAADQAHAIEAVATKDGRFTLRNGRNGHTKSY